jgi:catechol 2,3-dioxygenase-like lactoylglutathione lyase family enzyme
LISRDFGVKVEITGIEHIAINARDGEKTKDFYSRIMGFPQLETIDRGDCEITYFALPNGSRLEMFDYYGKNHSLDRQETDSGLRHLAFKVKDVASHEAQLKALGVEITLSTCDLPELNARVLLFKDPNGITIKFCENLSND